MESRLKDMSKPDPNHDDIDILFELQENGFLEISISDGDLFVGLTEKVIQIAHLARRHKIDGGQYNEFSYVG
jgi:hypothetical protein